MDQPNDRYAHVPGRTAVAPRTGDDDIAPAPQVRQRFVFLRSVPALRALDEDALWELARTARDETFDPGAEICAGDDADDAGPSCCHLVRGGTVVALPPPLDGDVQHLSPTVRLGRGEWFGDLGLFAAGPPRTSYRASWDEPVETVRLDAVRLLAGLAGEVLVVRLKQAQQRRGGSADGPLRVRELGMFANMPLHDIASVMAGSSEHSFDAGADIVTQGDEGDRFYVLLDGQAEVLRDGEALASIERGGFFGETALLFDCPRTATVRATYPARAWSVSRPAFERIARHYVLGMSQPRGASVRQRLEGLNPFA
jgi:CRP-like cAMP-binding protein